MEKELKPQITVVSFDEKEVNEYIEKLENIVDTYGPQQGILVKIDSYGGEVHGLAALHEKLVSMPNPIVTYTASKAMSAGAILLATAGTPGLRIASPNSSIMIHEIQTGVWFKDIKDVESDIDAMRELNKLWMGILAKSMGLKSAEDIRTIMQASKGRELYLTGQEAKEMNVVDQVAYLNLIPVNHWEIVSESKAYDKRAVTVPKPAKSTKKK